MIISQRIFDFLQKIPKNKVVTYKTLAEYFHIHPRAIARILASNREQNKYPCYKVICTDGSI
jgi:alkylated DNA nucleotide flippase Atl1